MTPVAEAIESDLQEKQSPQKSHEMIFAAFFPHFESLMSIIGSVFVVLPCLCYLKISQFKLASIVGIVVFGVVAGV
ncbi:hypothetical protein V2J09_001243 [Rumex salicifolius]